MPGNIKTETVENVFVNSFELFQSASERKHQVT